MSSSTIDSILSTASSDLQSISAPKTADSDSSLFSQHFLDGLGSVPSSATRGTDSSSSTDSCSVGLDSAVQDFLDYAKETPAQRMFDNWLSSQNITMSQYNAMPPAEQAKLVAAYQEYIKEHMYDALVGTGTAGTTAATATTAASSV